MWRERQEVVLYQDYIRVCRLQGGLGEIERDHLSANCFEWNTAALSHANVSCVFHAVVPSRLPPPAEPAQLAAVVKALKSAKKPVS